MSFRRSPCGRKFLLSSGISNRDANSQGARFLAGTSRRMRDAARRPLHGRRVRQCQVPSAMRCETGCGDRWESDAVRHKSLFGDGGRSEDGMAWLREPMQVRCVYSLRIFLRPDLVVFR